MLTVMMWFFNAMSVLICFLFTFFAGVFVGSRGEKKSIVRRLESQDVDPEVITKIKAMD